MRVTVDRQAVGRLVDRRAVAGVEAAARFMADRQREATRSSVLADAVTHESGRDLAGWYARAGMGPEGAQDQPAFFWYFEEYQSGRGGGMPFIRQALWSNSRQVSRLMTRGGAL